MNKVTRGSIFYADLDCGVGSEQKGIRPVVILQNDVGNTYSTTTMIAPITTKQDKENSQPTHVKLKQLDKLRPNSFVMLEQIRTIDKKRIKGFVCELNKEQMKKIDKAIMVALGIGINKSSL